MYSQQAVGLLLRPSNEGVVQTLGFLTGRCSPNRQLVGQRRRWESNPLQLLCRQPPGHLAPASFSVPARNRTWSTSFAGSRANPAHSKDIKLSTPPRNRTPSDRFEVCHAIHHNRRAYRSVSRPGVEPGPGPSEGPMLSATPPGHQGVATWNRTRTKTLGESCAVRYTIATQEPTTGFAPASTGLQDRRLSQSSHVGKSKQECKESNPAWRFWRPLASQKHTPVFKLFKGDRRELNPYLLLHRQTCLPRTPRTPC